MTVGVRACLLGLACRDDGRRWTREGLAERLSGAEVAPLCPEAAAGLPCPRPPAECRDGGVFDAEGRDRTEAFRRGAETALRLCRARGATHAVLCDRSPSCGVGAVYDGSFTGRLRPGDGVTAALLRENGVRVIGAEAFCAMTREERDAWLGA